MKLVVRPESGQLGHDKGITGAQPGHNKILSLNSIKPSNQHFCIGEIMRSLGESNEDNTRTFESGECYQTSWVKFRGHWEIFLSTSRETK